MAARPPIASVAPKLRQKSARIRALADAGFESGEIARHMALSEGYVLKVMSAQVTPLQTLAPPLPVGPRPRAAVVESDGRVAIPADMAEALGLAPMTAVVLRVEDGQLILLPRAEAERRAREMMGKLLP